MIPATFRVIGFPKLQRFIAVAWNYDRAVLISTRDHASYTDARKELDATCAERGIELRWFDGVYEYGGGDLLIPATNAGIDVR